MSNLVARTGSLDDVVFEGHNKAYEAFHLRQSYQHHLSSTPVITVAICSLLLLLPFVFRYFAPDAASNPSVGHVDRTIEPQNYVLPKIKLVVPAAAQSAMMVTPHSSFGTPVVPDADVKPTTASPLPPNVGKVNPHMTSDNLSMTSTSTGSGTAAVLNSDSANPAAAAPEIFLIAEVNAGLYWGPLGLAALTCSNIYDFHLRPLTAQVSGRVDVNFVMQTDGSIGDVAVLKWSMAPEKRRRG